MEEKKQAPDIDVESSEKSPVINNFTLPEESSKVGVGVKFNLKTQQVILIIGSKSVAFSISDARGLALALRQNANFIERHSN
ncbi:MAG: hypothetical protein CVU43_04655 [Chloroflexi bacterium HGW-Chloroflexi-5]|jgi:hypothetical protein|nr:MAG: hypothetical protein CVU43_04655 [Chloroflexi bacterium HGW-Chloroflexi-5]